MHTARRARAVAVLLVASVAVAGGCSSSASPPAATTTRPVGGSSAKASAVVHEANAACTAGKARTAKIALGRDVVPDPETPAQVAATNRWSAATATALERTASEVAAIAGEGREARDLAAIADLYRQAATTLRTDSASVLGNPAFLADQRLFDAGFTACVIPSPKPTK